MGKPPSGFSFKIASDGRVFIAWQGRRVVTLADRKAAKFISESANLSDADLQLLLARATGNFKHGNERSSRRE